MMWTRTTVRIRSIGLAGLLVMMALVGAAGVAALAPSTMDGTLEATAAVDRVILVDTAYEDPDTMLPVSVVFAGSQVRWLWTGAQTHSVTHGLSSVTGPEGAFDSGVRHAQDEPENGGAEDPFVVTFDDPGVYKYHCQVHPAQHGVLIVI